MEKQHIQSNDVIRASLEDLPYEIILKILKYLNIKDLFRCMAVNKKLRVAANDKSLWEVMHLTGEFPAELLKQVLIRGCQYLSLYSCYSPYERRKSSLESDKLKYLSVCNSNTFIQERAIPYVLCPNLEKVSVIATPTIQGITNFVMDLSLIEITSFKK